MAGRHVLSRILRARSLLRWQSGPVALAGPCVYTPTVDLRPLPELTPSAQPHFHTLARAPPAVLPSALWPAASLGSNLVVTPLLPPPFGARSYAKGKGKDKGGKKDKKGKKGQDSDDEDAAPPSKGQAAAGAEGFPELDLKDLQSRMDQQLDVLQGEFSKLRSGRASPGLVENIPVQAYGETMPLKDLGLIVAKDAQTLSVSLYDASVASAVEKAIALSPLGLNPKVAGDSILVPVATLSAEDRKEVVKLAGAHAEKAKVAVRARRKEAMDTLKTAKKQGRSEDEVTRDEKSVQKMTDDGIAKVEKAFDTKKQELLSLV